MTALRVNLLDKDEELVRVITVEGHGAYAVNDHFNAPTAVSTSSVRWNKARSPRTWS